MPLNSKYACITLNNYNDAHVAALRAAGDGNHVSYLVFGYEVSSTGTPHLQGYVEFTRKSKLRKMKIVLGCPTVHLEVRKGKAFEAADYCKKGAQSHDEWAEFGTFGPHFGDDAKIEEFGEISKSQQGKRNDVAAAMARIQTYNRRRDMILDPENATFFMNYPNFCENYFKEFRSTKHKVEFKSQADWQTAIIDRCSTPCTDKRHVYWYWSNCGNIGKSTTARALLDHHEAAYFDGGDYKSIAYTYDYQPIVVFNFAKSKDMKTVSYKALEALKDGCLFSTKYRPVTKRFSPPHVVCFANKPPLESEMSSDRWIIVELGEDGPVAPQHPVQPGFPGADDDGEALAEAGDVFNP